MLHDSVMFVSVFVVRGTQYAVNWKMVTDGRLYYSGKNSSGVDVIIKLITVFEVLVDLVGSVILTFTFRSLLT